MSRRLSIAIGISTAVHAGLLAVVGGWQSDEALAHKGSAPLLVNLELQATASELTHDDSSIPTLENDPVVPTDSQRASLAAETPTETPQPIEMVVATELRPGELSPERDVADVVTERSVVPASSDEAAREPVIGVAMADIDPQPQQAVVATTSPDAERSVPVKTTLSAQQVLMFDEKIKEWSEELHEIPDFASGVTWQHDGREYLATFTQLPAADEMGIQRVIVEISTDSGGKRMSSTVIMKRLAFSNFAQFVNRWDPNVEIHDDELDGRFHSNTGINLLYDRDAKPVFHSKVTTASRGVRYMDRRARKIEEDIFLGGLETGVRPIRLPKHFVPFADNAEVTRDQVHRFTEDTRITFRADGSYVAEALDADTPRQLIASLSDNTTYIVADDKVALHVRGTVNGKVLVYSPVRIIIEDDLVYAANPDEKTDADDFLGLVSDKYVDIASPRVTGPGDLIIHAAIYAKRRFNVRRFNARNHALLYVYGSLSAGTLSATEPRFATRIRFDRRLDELRPPGFPLTNRYEVESWDEAWTVAPAR